MELCGPEGVVFPLFKAERRVEPQTLNPNPKP